MIGESFVMAVGEDGYPWILLCRLRLLYVGYAETSSTDTDDVTNLYDKPES